MSRFASKYTRLLFILALSVTASCQVNAASFVFSQSGFPDGGRVTGFFDAKDDIGAYDANGNNISDGIICIGYGFCDAGNDSLTSFKIHFSGSPDFKFFDKIINIESFNIELFSLKYIIKLNQLGFAYGTNRFGSAKGDLRYVAGYYGPGSIRFKNYATDTLYDVSTNEAVSVSQVPIPPAFVLFGTGLIWLTGKSHYKTKS